MMEEDLVDSLIDSARYNDVEDVIACIEGGASVNGQNESGSTGRCIIYQYLYTRVPIMTSSIHCTALHMAAANGHMESARILLEKGAVGFFFTI